MINCAVICEYNPFHSGHLYQLDRIRGHGIDKIVCIMSGNFVQSALPAFCDKSIRAECAVKGGADAVIELPALYATASAGYFAEGALKLISNIRSVSRLAMGATANADKILHIADLRIKRAEEYSRALKRYLQNGKSYNIANISALCELGEAEETETVVNEPNNMLCIEYVCAISKYAPNIEPLIIRRCGANHNEKTTAAENISATAIRNSDLNSESLRKFIPYNFEAITNAKQGYADVLNSYKKIALFSLKTADISYLKQLRDCSEGMEYMLKSLDHISDYDGFVSAAVGKRYGKNRIMRMLLDCALNIKKEYFEYPFYTRLLACKSGFDFTDLPENVCIKNSDLKKAAENSAAERVLKIDEDASALYNTLRNIDGAYYNYSLIKL